MKAMRRECVLGWEGVKLPSFQVLIGSDADAGCLAGPGVYLIRPVMSANKINRLDFNVSGREEHGGGG